MDNIDAQHRLEKIFLSMTCPSEDDAHVFAAASIALLSIADCRNELCLKCGKYKTAHEGACDGCRWKEIPQ